MELLTPNNKLYSRTEGILNEVASFFGTIWGDNVPQIIILESRAEIDNLKGHQGDSPQDLS